MDPDDMKQAWQVQSSQSQLGINAELLLREVQRNQRTFAAIILRRDIIEVGAAFLMVPFWIYMGAKLSLPWTWYLGVPAILWIAGFLLMDRMRHKRQSPEPGQPLRLCVESSLAQVEHQIWLLRNVFWWYILPPALSCLAFFAQVAWLARSGGWATAFIMAQVVAVAGGILVGVYWLNQRAVRTELEPRRQELESLLASFQDETTTSE
jgi:hypothetical protein